MRSLVSVRFAAVLSAILLVAGCVAGWFIRMQYIAYRSTAPTQLNTSVREQDPNYPLISPLLLCAVHEVKQSSEYAALNKKVSAVVEGEKKQGNVKEVSVYFRDLTSGRWAGLNEDAVYSPASLLKVPTQIAFLKFAEENPKILDKKITYGDGVDENAVEAIKPLHPIEKGKTYTVRQLIDAMITDSDNNARRLLHGAIDANWIKEVYTDLGLSVPKQGDGIDFMSAKAYTYFFRVLFNGSYLGREFSEQALETLSKTSYQGGLVAGLPVGIRVAHKFGEREVVGDSESYKELHDCGIIYAHQNPYLLCVMTKGADFTKLAGVIKNISAVVYADMVQ